MIGIYYQPQLASECRKCIPQFFGPEVYFPLAPGKKKKRSKIVNGPSDFHGGSKPGNLVRNMRTVIS